MMVFAPFCRRPCLVGGRGALQRWSEGPGDHAGSAPHRWRRSVAVEGLAVAELPAHGTRYRYQLGCRCADCRAANATYVRAHRAGACGTRSEPAGTAVEITTERIAWQPRRWAELVAQPLRARDW
jgi:hypothetical protein